jgi:hypothetical protein
MGPAAPLQGSHGSEDPPLQRPKIEMGNRMRERGIKADKRWQRADFADLGRSS